MATVQGASYAANDGITSLSHTGDRPTSATASAPTTASSRRPSPNTSVPPQQNNVSPHIRIAPAIPSRLSNIRIRRPSALTIARNDSEYGEVIQSGRRRSSSAPQRPQGLGVPEVDIPGRGTMATSMAAVREEPTVGTYRLLHPATSRPSQGSGTVEQTLSPVAPRSRVRRVSKATLSAFGIEDKEPVSAAANTADQEYDSSIIDLLDVVDPEVSTLSTLTNVQNSLFVPDLGRYLNRRLTYELTSAPTKDTEPHSSQEHDHKMPPTESIPTKSDEREVNEGTGEDSLKERRTHRRKFSISSELDDSHYAVLPHNFSVEDWKEEDIRALDDHVRHQLHSRKAIFRRKMRGFRKYNSKPLGFFVTLYAALITLFGLIWVLFIIGWISVDGRQRYLTHVVDNVLVALFAVVGDGLAPFRAVDTYHMCFIAHYHSLMRRLRRKKRVLSLRNEIDHPQPSRIARNPDNDLESSSASVTDEHEFWMLNSTQRRRLEHHQNKFRARHTFYKPHETATHRAFPLPLLIAAVVLLDCHSLFQIALGAFTWGWSYHTRPEWITAVILSLSISVNIAAGIVITIGDRKTRKKEVIEQMFRQEVTAREIRKAKKKQTATTGAQKEGVENVEDNEVT
ncbi:MAG: hypothetical protein Q9163_003342 [Psora crenata]